MVVKRLREQNNWSQEQLAIMSGLSIRTIQRIEKGNKASLETLKALASVFDVSVDTLKEEITVINKDSQAWKDESWWFRYNFVGVQSKRSISTLEYLALALGLCMTIINPSPKIAAIALLLSYALAKLNHRLVANKHW